MQRRLEETATQLDSRLARMKPDDATELKAIFEDLS